MPTSDPLAMLVAHDAWATRQILEACRNLTPEQFHQSFEMGRGSLHDSCLHILAALQGWSDLLAQRDQRERLDAKGRQHDVAELFALLDDTSAEFTRLAHEHPVDEIVTGSRGGKEYSFARGAVVTHVTTHGMHHRAQCLNMLRHLGVEPLPPSSVMEWIFLVDKN